MSAPAQKVAPAPVSTSARTARSAAGSAKRPGRARHIAAVIALRFVALQMTTVATPSATPCASRGCGFDGSMHRMLFTTADHMIK